jgi:hypothetical protein
MSNYETRGREREGGDRANTGRKDSPSPKPLRVDQIVEGSRQTRDWERRLQSSQNLLEVPSDSRKQSSSRASSRLSRTPSELSPLPSGTPSESSGPPSRSSELPSASDNEASASRRSEQNFVLPNLTIEHASRSPSELPSSQISRELSGMSRELSGPPSRQSGMSSGSDSEAIVIQGSGQQLAFPDITIESEERPPSWPSSGQISRALSGMSSGSDSGAVSRRVSPHGSTEQLQGEEQSFKLPNPAKVPLEESTAEAAKRQREAAERQRLEKLRGIFKGAMDTEKS